MLLTFVYRALHYLHFYLVYLSGTNEIQEIDKVYVLAFIFIACSARLPFRVPLH